MNKKLLTAVVGAALATAGGAANAIDLKISGALNRAVMYADDGVSGETYHVDNNTYPSRFRFLASDEIAPGITAGVNWETGINSNPSASVTQTSKSVAATVGERWQEVYFQGAFGKLGIGQGASAQKDIANIDLSQTDLASSGNPADIGGSIKFRTVTTPASGPNGPKFSDALPNFDDNRYDRVMYTTPNLGPVTVSASSGTDSEADKTAVAVRFAMDLAGGGKIAGGVGHLQSITGPTAVKEKTNGGSVSWLAPFGLNVTGSYTKRKDENSSSALARDGKFMKLKVGYIAGEHAVSAHYAKGEAGINSVAAPTVADLSVDDKVKSYGVEYNFKPKPWADIYAGVAVSKLDRPGVAFEDIKTLVVGSRITF